MRIMVTGGAGFIGCNLIRMLIRDTRHMILNVDTLTYAGNKSSITDVASDPRHSFLKADIRNEVAMRAAFENFQPDWVIHLAAETHVDRSIENPGDFIETNIVGTYHLLQATRTYFEQLPSEQKATFRFLHASTDEVYGSLGTGGFFEETSAYNPHSPYSATKAASDHLVRAWSHTYGLPTLITSCSNNYGPYQFPEKLFPFVILSALRGESIPVYGKGENVRDWIYVEDHVEALLTVVTIGVLGETYNIGANNEWRNIDLVHRLCQILDELQPRRDGASYMKQITLVSDRPGHDLRYALNTTKIRNGLGWSPKHHHHEGFRKTVEWYLNNMSWAESGLQSPVATGE